MGNPKNPTTAERQQDQNAARESGRAIKNQTPDTKDGLYPKQAPVKDKDEQRRDRDRDVEREEVNDEMQQKGRVHERPTPNDPSRVDRTEKPERENDPTRIRRETNDPGKVDPTRIAE